MNPKIKDEAYLMLPYGRYAIPTSMASEFMKHAVLANLRYNSELRDYEIEVSGIDKNTMDATLVSSDSLKAAMIAGKLEKA